MPKHGKKYNNALEQIDKQKAYEPSEGVALAKRVASAKFDETVEVHIRTGADPRHADQMVRGVAVLPHGVGKVVRVLVFAQGDAAGIAEQAGADFVGGDELIQRIERESFTDFDVSIATPDMMGRVGRLGRVLGRRGLMPNPRTGTVVAPDDIPRAIDEAKRGRVEYRLDRTAIIHAPIGKVSFEENMLLENLASLMDNITRARPSGVKGQYLRSAFLTTTMGPSIQLDIASASAMRVE
jgi:large subunit ribosomal protein L1